VVEQAESGTDEHPPGGEALVDGLERYAEDHGQGPGEALVGELLPEGVARLKEPRAAPHEGGEGQEQPVGLGEAEHLGGMGEVRGQGPGRWGLPGLDLHQAPAQAPEQRAGVGLFLAELTEPDRVEDLVVEAKRAGQGLVSAQAHQDAQAPQGDEVGVFVV